MAITTTTSAAALEWRTRTMLRQKAEAVLRGEHNPPPEYLIFTLSPYMGELMGCRLSKRELQLLGLMVMETRTPKEAADLLDAYHSGDARGIALRARYDRALDEARQRHKQPVMMEAYGGRRGAKSVLDEAMRNFNWSV